MYLIEMCVERQTDRQRERERERERDAYNMHMFPHKEECIWRERERERERESCGKVYVQHRQHGESLVDTHPYKP